MSGEPHGLIAGARRLLSGLHRRLRLASSSSTGIKLSPEWKRAQERLRASSRLIDLGCGTRPHPQASVGVDAFLDARQRDFGHGEYIDPTAVARPGFTFVQAELSQLPFPDKSFDFAYSRHVFEHLPDPKAACSEACRVAGAGLIVTPSPFCDIAFGRPYHLWLVFARGNTLVFVRKGPWDNDAFGKHTEHRNGRRNATAETNPFEILLNYDNWYRGRERMPRLSALLRRYWHGHWPVMETIFLWEGCFDCLVIDEDGQVT